MSSEIRKSKGQREEKANKKGVKKSTSEDKEEAKDKDAKCKKKNRMDRKQEAN